MLKRILHEPWPDWRLVRLKRWIELLWRITTRYGYFESAWNGIPLRNGKPIPWIAFPAIEFLNKVVPRGATVFEYGCGASTLWWLERGNHVRSIESDEAWWKLISDKARAKGYTKFYIEYSPKREFYHTAIARTQTQFDVIVIDGLIEGYCRYACLKEAVKRLKPYGIIVLDNADWLPESRRFIGESGLYCIPFCGMAPMLPYSTTTMVLLKDPNILRTPDYLGKIKLCASPINGLKQDME